MTGCAWVSNSPRIASGSIIEFLAVSFMVPLLQSISRSRQLLLCVASGWKAVSGQLFCFSRSLGNETWQPFGLPMAVMLGRAGLAWGRGLHPREMVGGERQKIEGDGCAPAGAFAITTLFGEALPERAFARALRMPYLSATADLKAVDDPASRYYNRIVDRSTIASADWSSCEDMLRDDRRYAVGAVVAHNSAPPVPGDGSCIFLHVWARDGVPTAGCTAMSEADMTTLAAWLDADASPLLVQLPQAEYVRWPAAWGLPALPEAWLSGVSRPD